MITDSVCLDDNGLKKQKTRWVCYWLLHCLQRPTSLLSPQALWKMSSSTLIYIHQTEETRIRSISEFLRICSHIYARSPMCANTKEVRLKPTLNTEESFPRAAPSAAGRCGCSSFGKKVLGWHFAYFKSCSQSFKTWIFSCRQICLKIKTDSVWGV